MAIYDAYTIRAQFIDGLDDEVQYEVSNSFEGGQLSNARGILLQPNQVAQLTNIDLTLQGECTTRRGTIGLAGVVGGVSTTEGVMGMYWYSTSTNEYLVAVNNALMYQWTGASWTQICNTWSNASTTAMTHFAQLSNKLYFCNGTVNLFSFDGTTTTDLGNASNTQPPATPTRVAAHTNRLVAVGAGANRNSLYFSQFLDGTTWDKTRWSIQIGDDNDEITAIHSWTNFNLIVFKRHSIWIVNCDPSLQLQDVNGTIQFFEVQPVHKKLGCIAPLSAQQVGNDVLFLSQHGIYSINKLISAGSDTEIGPDLSYPVHDLIDRIPSTAIAKSSAVGYGTHYILSIPQDNDVRPSTALVWSDALQAWSGIWTGWNASCFAYCSPTTGNLLRIGTNSGGGTVLEWLDYVQLVNEIASTYQDAGVNIPCSVTTRAYSFGGVSNLKTPSMFRMDFYKSLASGNLTAQFDRDNPQSIATFVGSGGQGVVFPLQFPVLFPAIKTIPNNASLQKREQFAAAQFTVSTTAGKFNMVSCAIGAWLDTIDNRGPWIGGVTT